MVTSCGLRSTITRSTASSTIRPPTVASQTHRGTFIQEPPVRTHRCDRRSLPPVRKPAAGAGILAWRSVLTTSARRNTPLHCLPFSRAGPDHTSPGGPNGRWRWSHPDGSGISDYPRGSQLLSGNVAYGFRVARLSRSHLRRILVALVAVIVGAAGVVWLNSADDPPAG